jgi:hypothetical protein
MNDVTRDRERERASERERRNAWIYGLNSTVPEHSTMIIKLLENVEKMSQIICKSRL